MESEHRLRFMLLQVDNASACHARVDLSSPSGSRFVGTADGEGSVLGKMSCAARASVEALQQSLEPDDAIELRGVETVKAFHSEAVMVNISLRRQGVSKDLVGFCLAPRDTAQAAALAVLNATNRVLTLGQNERTRLA